MTNHTSVSFMTTKSPGFKDAPVDIQLLAFAAETDGFCNFWYTEEYGLFADAPNAGIEDDRVPVTWEVLNA